MFEDNRFCLSTEMIQPQENDELVHILNKYCMELITSIKGNNLSKNKVYKHRETSNIIKLIDRAVYDRFGIKIKSIYSDTTPLGILTTPPNNLNILNDSNVDFYSLVKMILKNAKAKDISDGLIIDYEKQHNEVLSRWLKSVDRIDKKIEQDGLIIDLKNAKIHGMDSKYVVFMLADYSKLVNDLDLNNNELTAAILHEVGHAFTHIEYSYRSVKNTSILLDSVREIVEKKNGSPLNAFKLAYKNLGDDIMSNDVKTMPTAYIKLADKYIKSSLYMGNNTYGNTDSEALADNFATNFFIGSDLTTALLKLHDARDSYFVNNFDDIISVIVNLLILLLIISISGVLLVVLVGILMYLIISIITSVITTGGTTNGDVYDTDYQRFKRVKQNIIRIIRNSDYDKKTIKNLIHQIDTIEKAVELSSDTPNASMLDRVIRVITPNGRALTDAKELDIAMGDLINNDLHTQKAKINTLL